MAYCRVLRALCRSWGGGVVSFLDFCHPDSVSVYLGSKISSARDYSRSEVDGFVP